MADLPKEFANFYILRGGYVWSTHDKGVLQALAGLSLDVEMLDHFVVTVVPIS